MFNSMQFGSRTGNRGNNLNNFVSDLLQKKRDKEKPSIKIEDNG